MTYRVVCECGYTVEGLSKPRAEAFAAAHRDDEGHDADVEEEP